MRSIKRITGAGLLASCLIFSAVSVLFVGGRVETKADPETVDSLNVLPLTTGVDFCSDAPHALLQQQVNFVIVTEPNSDKENDEAEELNREVLYPQQNLPVYIEDEVITETVTSASEQVTTTESASAQTTTKKKKKTTTAAPATTTAPVTTTTKAQTTTATTAASDASQSNDVFDLPTVVPISRDEYQMLCYVVQGEAGGTSLEQLRAVVHVVINRVKSSKFPNTISGVLTAPNQFTTIKNYYRGVKPADSMTKQAIYEVLCNIVPDNSQGALYFYYAGNGIKTDSWFETKLTFLYQYGTDRFFK